MYHHKLYYLISRYLWPIPPPHNYAIQPPTSSSVKDMRVLETGDGKLLQITASTHYSARGDIGADVDNDSSYPLHSSSSSTISSSSSSSSSTTEAVATSFCADVLRQYVDTCSMAGSGSGEGGGASGSRNSGASRARGICGLVKCLRGQASTIVNRMCLKNKSIHTSMLG